MTANAKTQTRKRVRQRRPENGGHSELETRLLAAIEEALEEGASFAALSVSQISRKAGIGRATFYLHFRDKGELVHRLMQRLTAEVVENAGAWFLDDAVDARSMQLALIGILKTFHRHGAILAAVNETAPHDASVQAAYQAMLEQLSTLSRKAVLNVVRQGKATAFADEALADLMTRFIEAYCARGIRDYDEAGLRKLTLQFSDICGRAIFADYPDSRPSDQSGRHA